MKIYKKLAEARVKLQDSGIKKTGYNGFSKYDYFQLSDFLPETNRIFKDIGLCAVFNIDVTTATLTIYDTDEEGSIVFTSPTAEAVRGRNYLYAALSVAYGYGNYRSGRYRRVTRRQEDARKSVTRIFADSKGGTRKTTSALHR